MRYEDALCYWVVDRFDIPFDTIQSVLLEHEPRGDSRGCDTCGFGADECSICVYVHYKDADPRGYDTFDISADFMTLLQEILLASAPTNTKGVRERLLVAERELAWPS